MSDPWRLDLRPAMRSALLELARHGKLYRMPGGYGADVLARKFQELTILGLVERGLVRIARRGRHLSTHYARLTATGKLFAQAQDGRR